MKSKLQKTFAVCMVMLSLILFASPIMAQSQQGLKGNPNADNDAGIPTMVSMQPGNTSPLVCTTWVGSVGPANNPVSLRAFRDGVASSCAVPGPCTPSTLAGAFHYVQRTWTNPVNAVQCVTVTYNNPTTNFSFVTAHNGSVTLTDFCVNYLGDPGSSALAGQTIVWSFNAPPLATIVFHIGNVVAGQTADYSIIIDAATCGGATPPSVTINQAAAQPDPTGISPINFTAVFSQVVTGFATGDVTLSGTAGATTGTVTGSGTTYNVAVSGMTASGTVIATIPAGVCINATGDPNTASTSTDNTVTYNLPPPATCTNTISYTGPPVAIPDALPAGVNIPLVISGIGTITDLNFRLDPGAGVCDNTIGNTNASVDHTFNSDLIFRLTSPLGTTVTLISQKGGSGDNFCLVTLDDDGAFPPTSTMPITGAITGNYAPENPLSAFDGQNATGTWILNVSDVVGADIGSLRRFSLIFTTIAPTVIPVPNQTVCTGQSTTAVNFTGTPASVVYQWTNSNTQIGLAASGLGNIASFVATNPTAAPITGIITVTPVTGLTTPITTTFNYTGAMQTFTVPAGITSLSLKAWGAQGNANALSVVGGLGGYAEGNLAVTPGQVLNVFVGGGATTSINGGFNGGGNAGANTGCVSAQGGGGGGASDVRIAPYALANRVLVGAGGGGAGGNRVQGCGPGSGGGGGGGYYGGGGGGAYQGTGGGGGTQAIGGAGGIGNFGGGNGTAGALGVGGVGGLGLANNQAGNQAGGTGGVGGGLTGAAGTSSPTTTWVGGGGGGGSSYIGGVTAGITTSGLRTGAGMVTITYQPISAATCFGTPITFTITVNPNPSLVIVADPGSVLCQGDPALLTVRVGSSSPVGTLYNQTGVAGNGSPSQVFEPANAAFTSQAADDFVVPAGAVWTITQITTFGINSAGGVPTSVNVFFYNNSAANLPGTAIATFNNVLSFVRTGADYVVTLPSSVVLGAGQYWMSFQVNMSFATSGQWFWGNYGAANILNQYAWQNPGGGFGTPCTSWGYGATGCAVGGGVNRNNRFTIVGSSLADGGPLPPGYTFLWSPAAGLSSTTTNPVAASPATTTTYTVNVNTAQGCTNQASILMTVNLRPTVTTHPVSRTNCAGTSATFTVAGTGTGLTYQWQESPTGCAGPWTNLVNGGAYSGVNTATLTVNPVTGLMTGYGYRCVLTGVCAPIGTANISNCAVLTINPLPVVAITPPVSCGGVAGISGTLLSVGSAPPPVPGSVTVNSGAISIPVPDNNVAGVSSNLSVATIPANATITNVRATWTMPHTWNGDMVFVLRSPNGSILNLDYYLTATGGAGVTTGFVGTTVSSAGVNALSTGTGTYSATFAADARTVAQAPFGPPGPTGFAPTISTWPPMYTPIPNGTWTLAMYDGGALDVGTLTNWSITIDYTTPGGGGGPVLSYVWSPLAGLYTNATATNPYLGTNTPTVYAAPTALTVYTVTATDVATGCFSSATAVVNYTPPPPTVTPASVTMCLGDPAVRLTSASSTTTTTTFTSGTINVPIPEGAFPTGPYPAGVSTIPVTGIPAAATISRINVRMNITHAYVGDVVAVLQAPNGQRLNLDALLTSTNNAGANFVNTVISSAGVTALSAGAAPWTNTYKADAVGATFVIFGFTLPGGPIGYIPTTQTWGPLTPTGASANGNWTLALYDAGAPDIGTLTNWSIDIVHVLGVPATPAIWSPLTGLFNDAAASIPYAGTARDTVWTRPTPAGVYPYQVTVQSVAPQASFTNPANIIINAAGIATPYPANLTVSGLPSSGISVDSVRLTGISHTWGDDIDILLQSPTGQNVVLMSDIGGTVAVPNATYTFRDGAPPLNATAANPTGTYRPTNNGAADTWPAPGPGAITQATPTLSMFGNTANVNGDWKLFVFDDVGGDAGNISGGFTIYFNIAIPACTSPPRTVIVTVNQPTTVVTQPVNQTVCTDKVATFTTAGGGTGPFNYQWQVSTNNGNTWTNIANGGVYAGATTTTLTISGPPVSMSGNQYRCVITGAAPCAAVPSFQALLTVNPLPTVVISASPYTSLFPGQVTTLSSTVSPAAASTYTWLRNGSPVAGSTGTLSVNVDGLGDYTLRVTDVNGCTNTSNMITIKDSASGNCFIYPNPNSGQFQVRYYSVANNVLPRSLTVYDAKGNRVLTQQYTIGRPYDRMDVDMRKYGKGLYWVEVGDINGNRLTMCRIVIQ